MSVVRPYGNISPHNSIVTLLNLQNFLKHLSKLSSEIVRHDSIVTLLFQIFLYHLSEISTKIVRLSSGDEREKNRTKNRASEKEYSIYTNTLYKEEYKESMRRKLS